MANGLTSAETRHLRTLFALGAAGSLTDGQLLERFATRTGDPAELAFAALVERHGPMVLRVARATLGDDHSAHDAFQATFLILARKARSLWVRDSLGPWLHAVAFRVANHSRALEARRRRHEQAASRPEAHDPRDWSRDDLARAIHEEIERLPEPYRAAIVTCHLEGLTQQDAAHRLGWPIGTLQSRLARGRQRLRDRLRRRGLAPSLGVLAGKLAPVPNALVASTAQAAATLNLGGAIAGMIAPAVLAMIETTTKGMLMTKLKLGAVALVMTGGLVASTVLVVLDPARATEGPTQASEPGPAPRSAEKSRPNPPTNVQPELTAADDTDSDGPIPPPADGPGFPYLLEFFETHTVGGLKSHQEVASLARQGYPIKSFDVAIYSGRDSTPGRDAANQYEVYAYPEIVLVDGVGDEIARMGALEGPSKIAAFYNENRSKSAKKARVVDSATTIEPIRDDEPGLTIPSNPKPWETVVRVKISTPNAALGLNSGVVIRSTDSDSLILTCAHNLRPTDRSGSGSITTRENFKGRISVDLFDGKLARQGPHPAKVGIALRDLPAELYGYDLAADLAVLLVKTDRRLPASPLVPRNWKPSSGMKMYSVGCSNGSDATAWDTTLLDMIARYSRSGDGLSPAVGTNLMKCTHEPKPGRSGGGLYTTDGYLAGVCNYADPAEHVGLYAPPEEIRRFLTNQGLGIVHEGVDPTRLKLGSIDVAEDRVVERDRTEITPSTRDLHDSTPAVLEPAPRRAVSDQDHRLDDLERKLDRVLKALEDLKGDKTSDQLKGDFPRKR